MKKMGIKNKLILSLLAASLIPLVSISYYAYWKAEESMRVPMMEQINSIKNVTKAQLTYYFNSVKAQVIALSQNVGTKDALSAFTQGFNQYQKDLNYQTLHPS
jgi:hypothetical protein